MIQFNRCLSFFNWSSNSVVHILLTININTNFLISIYSLNECLFYWCMSRMKLIIRANNGGGGRWQLLHSLCRRYLLQQYQASRYMPNINGYIWSIVGCLLFIIISRLDIERFKIMYMIFFFFWNVHTVVVEHQ